MAAEHLPMEEMELFRRYVAVADWAWAVVHTWPPLARSTLGEQLIRACDSVGANLVEGDGRRTVGDGLHFLTIARASAREARYWVERARKRNLLSEEDARQQFSELTSATQLLNRLIAYRKSRGTFDRVREELASYTCNSDPFTDPPEYPIPEYPNT